MALAFLKRLQILLVQYALGLLVPFVQISYYSSNLFPLLLKLLVNFLLALQIALGIYIQILYFSAVLQL